MSPALVVLEEGVAGSSNGGGGSELVGWEEGVEGVAACLLINSCNFF